MSGMPLFQALLLVASVFVLIVATQSRHLHPFLAIAVIASVFGLVAGFSLAFSAKPSVQDFPRQSFLLDW